MTQPGALGGLLIEPPWPGIAVAVIGLAGLFHVMAACILSRKRWGFNWPKSFTYPLGVLGFVIIWRAVNIGLFGYIAQSALITSLVWLVVIFIGLIHIIVRGWRVATEKKADADLIAALSPTPPLELPTQTPGGAHEQFRESARMGST